MKRLTIVSLSALLVASTAPNAFGWSARGGSASGAGLLVGARRLWRHGLGRLRRVSRWLLWRRRGRISRWNRRCDPGYAGYGAAAAGAAVGAAAYAAASTNYYPPPYYQPPAW